MNKQKKLLSVLLSMIFAIGMLFGGGVLSAFADDSTIGSSGEITSFYVPAKISYMDKFSDYGFDAATAPMAIVAPNAVKPDSVKKEGVTFFDGNRNAEGVYTGVEADFVFDQVGIYRFDYLSNDGSKVLYSKTARCTVDGELELRVDYGGADIPTYTAEGEEGKFEVPNATLFFKSEDMDAFEALEEGTDYTLTVTTVARDADNAAVSKDLEVGKEFYFEKPGSYSIVYNAKLRGGTKNYTRSFNVKVQGGGFSDSINPKVTVTGVPTTGSVNSKITLPKASATDEYDENIKVFVSVKLAGVDVPKTILDKKTGFAVDTEKGADGKDIPVVFDNVNTMEFYPRLPANMTSGQFNVLYYAVDDFGNKSSERTFTILVEDRSAPTLYEIDEWQIPSRWGLNEIVRSNENYDENDPASEETVSLKASEMYIRFPYPVYIDNSGKDAISRVSFEIRDTVNNHTVLRFHNIYATGDSADNVYQYKADSSSGYYMPGEDVDQKVIFTDKGFLFDFSKYVNSLKSKESSKDGLGRYTVQYQARDKSQNITTKTYDITLEDKYTDDIVPNIDVTFDEYLYFAKDSKSYTVPPAAVTDAGTTRTHVEYTIQTLTDENNPVEETNIADTLTVKSGERLRIERDGSTILLANADYRYAKENYDRADKANDTDAKAQYAQEMEDLSVEIDGKTKLVFTVTATDAVGNNNTETATVRLVLHEEIENQTMNLAIQTVDIEYTKNFATATKGYEGAYKAEFAGIGEKTILDRINVSGPDFDKFNLGAFAITGVNDVYRDYVGFEMKLTDAAGVILDGISFETFYATGSRYHDGAANGMIIVDNITVGLPEAKEPYRLMLRAFDINGNSTSTSFSIEVKDGTASAGEDDKFDKSVAIGSEGNVYVTYTLKNKDSFPLRSNADEMRRYMVRKVSGVGNFTLMGSEFTALSQGSCFFEEGYYAVPDTVAAGGTSGSEVVAVKGKYKPVETSYTFDVNDAADTTFEVQGKMPTYAPKGDPLQLPSVIAHNDYANATVKVEVKRPSGPTLTSDRVVRITAAGEYYGGYEFTPLEDGKYIVTYTANINNSPAGSQTFTIVVGDNIAPTFKVTDPEPMKLNSVFKFAKMDILASSDDIKSGSGANDSNKWDDIKFTKRLILPNGETHVIPSDWGKTTADKEWTAENEDNGGYTLTMAGDYTIEYIAEDRAENQSKIVKTFTITGEGGGPRVALKVLSTVLIILALLLIAGVILYFTRFQKKKIKA